MAFDLRFKTPFNLILSGVSQSGKTTFCKNLLTISDEIFRVKPDKVFLFYKAMQPIYTEMHSQGLIHELIDVSENFPTLDHIHNMISPYKDQKGSLIIFDDILNDISKPFETLFCNASHHMNTSIILIVQNLFYKEKSFRTLSLNSHYIVIMKNPRDKQQVSILARQFNPNNPKFVIESFEEATKKPHSYLFIDFHPETKPTIRLRSDIFKHEFPIKVYLEK